MKTEIIIPGFFTKGHLHFDHRYNNCVFLMYNMIYVIKYFPYRFFLQLKSFGSKLVSEDVYADQYPNYVTCCFIRTEKYKLELKFFFCS